MTKLITLGCSITAQTGVKETLSSLLGLENLNLSYSAGSNQLQISRLMELIVNNKINKDDLVYWQITYVGRGYQRLKLDHEATVKKIQETEFKLPYHHYTISEFQNLFDKEKRIDILCNSPLVQTEFDEEEEIQKLLGTIILLKQLCNKLIIVFGWKRVLSRDQEKIFKKVLNDNNVNYVEEYHVDYVKEKNMEMMDDNHPSAESNSYFAKEVIFEKIKMLNWI